MIDIGLFVLAALALLATPGPTNTLMAAAGAQRGPVAALPLVSAELVGYGLAILIWSEVVGAMAGQQAWVPAAARLVAGLFLLWSALKLWRTKSDAEAPQAIGWQRVFMTTVLNPKALVFGLVIVPALPLPERAPYFLILAGLILATASGWILLGSGAARIAGGRLTGTIVNRIAASALAVFAALLLVDTWRLTLGTL
jgi:threonine/homoserine/homoserine lactone efflux protein